MIHLTQDEHEEVLHPLWLGILMLFAVILGVGMMCLVRKKYGTQLCRAFNRLCGRTELPTDHSKDEKHAPTRGLYTWTPVYVPRSSRSPKLYSVVRNIRMASFERESSMKQTEGDDIDEDLENEVFAVGQTSPTKTSSPALELPPVTVDTASGPNRNCETARRFYASMRNTTLGQTTSSVDSATADPPLLSTTRMVRAARTEKLKFFRTHGFFYSITNKK